MEPTKKPPAFNLRDFKAASQKYKKMKHGQYSHECTNCRKPARSKMCYKCSMRVTVFDNQADPQV